MGLVDTEGRLILKYKKRAGTSPLKRIRAHCVECMGGKPFDVAGCTSVGCALYQMRDGTKPTPEEAREWADSLEGK